MDVILLSRAEEREGAIEPIDYKHTEPINGLETFEFQCVEDTYKIEKKKRVLFKTELGIWKEFVIESYEKMHTDEGIIVSVYAENSITETTGDYIEDRRPTNQTAAGALGIALETSRWKVGSVDVPGLKSTTFYRCSVHEAIAKVIEIWGGEIRTRVTVQDNRITGRFVDLFQRRGENRGRRFEWTKDIEEIKRKVSEEQIITALYGYGKGIQIGEGFSRRIDFAAINGGKAYVEDDAARLRYGPKNADGTSRHIFGKYECDLETPEEVLAETQKKLKEFSTVKVSYEAKVINLAKYGFEIEGVELGDEVTIVDKEIGTVRARITVKTTRPDNQEDDLIIGNYVDAYSDRMINTGNKLAEFSSKVGIWDRAKAFDEDGKINSSFMKDVLKAFNTELNSSDGYVYAEPGKGIFTYDKPPDQNPEGVTQILAAGLRIASSKLADGSWDWKTAITSMGIIADVIYTGRIQGQTSYYDLDAGVLSFKAEMAGKIVEVRMSISGGFEIFQDKVKIGGLSIVDDQIMLLANGMSNNPAYGWVEMGTVPYTQYGNPFETQGMKIHYLDNGTWHSIAMANHPSGTGVVFVKDGTLLGNLREDGFYITARKTEGEETTENTILAMGNLLKLMSIRRNTSMELSSGDLTFNSMEGGAFLNGSKLVSISSRKGSIGVNEDCPYIGSINAFRMGNGSMLIDRVSKTGLFFNSNGVAIYRFTNPSDPSSGTLVKTL